MADQAPEREAEGATDHGGGTEEAAAVSRVELEITNTEQVTKDEAALLLLQECRNLLEEIRDRLTPDDDMPECPKCGSTHLSFDFHGGDYPCSAGPCIRGELEGTPHFLNRCESCSHRWAEAEQ